KPPREPGAWMEQIADALTLLLEGWSRRLLGSIAERTVVGSVDWGDLLTAGAILLLTVVANSVLALLFRRESRPAPADAGSLAPKLRPELFVALGKPIYALVWGCGIYAAATPMMSLLKPLATFEAIRTAAATLFDVGLFAVITWFFLRFTR